MLVIVIQVMIISHLPVRLTVMRQPLWIGLSTLVVLLLALR